MMTEKELIAKIRELRQIKPNRDWVILTKSQILDSPAQISKKFVAGEEIGQMGPIRLIRLILKPAYAGLVVVFILFGLFGLSQNSLPGDLLYPIKKMTEKSQAVFVSEEEKPQVSLELAEKKLTELTKVAQTNQVKKLAPAINEFEKSLSEAAKNLSKIETVTSDPMAVKRTVDQAKDIEKKAKEVNKSLGVVTGEEGLNELSEVSTKLELELLVSVLQNMISDLESRTLTEKQEEILNQMKELVEQEKYSEALELYLTNQNQ